MENNNGKWVSVSSYAKMIGKSKTHVYSLVREGLVEHQTFQRGAYNGILIKYNL